ncbi:hypothetical protein [Granulosicoccus antarcticus]|uniref:Uncharacterized protein n=1 Tax=Granulosicoccus antarcticus IMCC3135 TaxID=1192854 RepID=A0A2Z2NNC8_9GAMM|nr:hypothetical protein [Granulosicoccus antarcticus]ASJ72972.1 hypothetical protein IMCC3135_14435 [Granulosicoccus antarcticus IMCC3135]
MGSLHHLPTAADAHARLLEQLVTQAIAAHPDPEVAQAWAAMARESIARYPSPPMPSQPVLDLEQVGGLDPKQSLRLQTITQDWLEGYLHDVRNQLMCIHRDFLVLQKRVAELEAAQGAGSPPA